MSNAHTINQTKKAMAQCLGVHPKDIHHLHIAGRLTFWVKDEPTVPVPASPERPTPVLAAGAFC